MRLSFVSPFLVAVLIVSGTTFQASASTPELALQGYFAARAQAMDGGTATAALARISDHNSALRSFTETDLNALQKLLAGFHGVTGRRHEYFITGQQGLTFSVYEKTAITWVDPTFRTLIPSTTLTSGVGYWHSVTVQSTPSGHVIATDAYRGLAWDSPDVQRTRALVEPSEGGRPRGLASLGWRPLGLTGTYNRSNATSYAFTYWSSYNPNYINFNCQGCGGDCTNFVSQSLFAGNEVMGPTTDSLAWWYDGTRPFPSSGQAWRYSVTHENWLINNGRAYHAGSANILNYGDVIYYDWNPANGATDHTVVVTGFDGSGRPWITSHNPDLGLVAWDNWMASYLIPYTPHFLGLWDTFTY